MNSLGLPRNSVASSMKAWPLLHRMKTALSAIFVGMWIFSPVIIDRPSSFSALAAHCRRALLRHPWAFLTGLAHLYNLIPYQRRAKHAGQCGVEVEGGGVSTRDWFLNLSILTSGDLRCVLASSTM